ncbi:MAG TPA: acyl-CoA synthetase [Acidimicrobiales bacterium]|nr:acyl-CoA synthetase [Acidimicrobiales bacterium]
MGNWNFADVWEAVAAAVPDAPCQIQGGRTVTWAEFDRRGNRLAADLLGAGLGHQAKVGAYLYNCPEYLETYLAAFKAGLVPVNTNYRYGPEEIVYLFDNADAEAVVFHSEFTPLLDSVRGRLPGVRRWYVVADGNPEPDWAVPYEPVVSGEAGRAVGPWGRSGDDILMLYTGGTTGMPKGVMYRQDDLFMALGGGGNAVLGASPANDIAELASRISGPGPRMLSACPLMHGTGQWSSFIALGLGGSITTLTSRRFDAAELWRTVQERQVNSVAIVGDAFAKPMLAELDANPGAYDLSSLTLISSSGVMWSHEVKEGLLKHHPSMMLFDSFGSTEAVGLGASLAVPGQAPDTAKFQLGERVRVFTDDGTPVEPGSDDVGMVALAGYLPLGYYKDPEKSGSTFREIGGVRYSIPGDYAMVNADGTLRLLGRGSVCINTGGEKVFPEEVEEVLKRHEAVRDAVCVGVPDERFGEAIVAVVEPVAGVALDSEALIEHVKDHLARYKAPRHVIVVDTIGRSPAGKVDYRGIQDMARRRLVGVHG